MDLDLECFHFFSPSSLHIHAKKISAIVGTERGRDGRDGRDREGGEGSREKGGKAEINTGLIDSTRPHAKLYEE